MKWHIDIKRKKMTKNEKEKKPNGTLRNKNKLRGIYNGGIERTWTHLLPWAQQIYIYLWSNFPWKRTWNLDEQYPHNKRQKRCTDKGWSGRDTASPSTPPQTRDPTIRKVKVKFAESCPTLYDPMGYTVHGILQARILEWVVFPFSRGFSQSRDQTGVSCIAGGFFTSWAMSKAHSQVVSLIRIPPIRTPNTKLSWGEKGLYLTSGIPTPGASTEKMSTHSVWFWKSKEIPTGRVCIAENRDSIFNCLSHRGRPRVHS